MNVSINPTKHIKVIHLEGNTPMIWNILAKKAYELGFANYFYQINDDVRIKTKGWNKAFIHALEKNTIKNFGVAGLLDLRTKHCMSQSFVSYLNWEIFGYCYPNTLTNWKSDPWITNFYGSNHTFWLKNYRIVNTNYYGRRYTPDKTAFQIYRSILLKGCNVVERWVRLFHSQHQSTIRCIIK